MESFETWEYKGIVISFPCKPYESQRIYTERVLDCLIDARNGLLESPTGTGKTLALLCASLAWQRHQRATAQREKLQGGPSSIAEPAGRTHRIFYSSRTHSQLAQVMGQFKRLEANSSAVALGSRDQLCIHPRVREKTTNGEKNRTCSFLIKSKQCTYYENYCRQEGTSANKFDMSSEIHDIEDLVKVSSRKRICPYYRSRELAETADITFLPYNYLLDRTIRNTLPAGLANSLVIIDEAHNISKVCEESTSLNFETQDIALAISEVESVLKLLEEKDGNPDIDSQQESELAIEDALLVKEILLKMEENFADMIKDKSLKLNHSYPGGMLITVLQKSSIDQSRNAWLSHVLQQMVDILGTMANMGARHSGRGLETILAILKTAYEGHALGKSSDMLNKFYNLYVQKSPKKETNLIFNIWCFHPGLAMQSVMECGTRCLILTSGTLKPMEVTSNELDIPFAVKFSGPHIINSDQILVRAIPKGVDDIILCSNFQNRNNVAFQRSLGQTIFRIMRQVPNGMLIFFPSYSVMEMCANYWKTSGIWDLMNKTKIVIMEPKDKPTFEQAINEFRKRAEDPTSMGACLLGVCRGKIAEGIDFSDRMARAVIITGIPFPNAYDPKVGLKKDYVNKRRIEKGATNFSLTGDDWYKLEAFRAVNQAVGRVIRHKNDFGAVFFLDKRFTDASVLRNLSEWVTKSASTTTLAQAVTDTAKFFNKFHRQNGDSKKAGENPLGIALNKRKDPPTTESKAACDKKVKCKKIAIKSNTADKVLRYRATNVVVALKEILTPEDLTVLKKSIVSYRETKSFDEFYNALQDLKSQEKINKEHLVAFKEFILPKDSSTYESYLKTI